MARWSIRRRTPAAAQADPRGLPREALPAGSRAHPLPLRSGAGRSVELPAHRHAPFPDAPQSARLPPARVRSRERFSAILRAPSWGNGQTTGPQHRSPSRNAPPPAPVCGRCLLLLARTRTLPAQSPPGGPSRRRHSRATLVTCGPPSPAPDPQTPGTPRCRAAAAVGALKAELRSVSAAAGVDDRQRATAAPLHPRPRWVIRTLGGNSQLLCQGSLKPVVPGAGIEPARSFRTNGF